MQINHTGYQTQISERIEIYRKGLSQCREYLLLQQFEDAAICGLKTILQSCNLVVPETSDFAKLVYYCRQSVNGLPDLNTSSMTLQEKVIVIEGILTERQAFYTQLQNLTH